MGILCLVLVLLHVSLSFSSSFPPPSPSSTHLCLTDQRDALLEFKNSISVEYCWDDYDNYHRIQSWNKSIDCCSWEGVKCDSLTGHVVGIDLSRSCLNGLLLANSSLFHLHNLQWLDLSGNLLQGSLLDNTSSLFHLHRLRGLNLAINNFKGTISSELFTQLVSLTHLNLSYYAYSGLIPYQISHLSSLVLLDLSDCSSNTTFEGQSFDMFARNLTKLTTLVLDSVDMSDVSVSSFLNFPSSLETLSLSYCKLQGEFPSQVFQLPNLKHIDFSGSRNLTGYLPRTNWGSALESLKLPFCSFRGSIPASLGNLTQIIFIDLSGNQFEGEIPDVFGNLTKLTSLSFSYCNLSSPLPITMFSLPGITSLAMSHNRLEGPLPNHVSELQLLQELDLSHNAISGGLPSWLFSLPSLLRLDLGYNKLASRMDRFRMHSSANLSELYLQSNNLSGAIQPDMLSKLTGLRVLDLSNNRLLSLNTNSNDVNYSFPLLSTVFFSNCSIRQFPSFFRTSNLEVLEISGNMISGGISKWEAQGWVNLKVLNLSHNSLTTLEQFPGKSLQVLDLNSNLLQGPVLSTCFNHPIPDPLTFTVLLVTENNLTGNIPSSICNFTSLQVLDLSKNSLTGTIPECLGNFSYVLRFIDLQMNNLYGSIPDSFMNNMLLSHLLLNDNQLEGLVPPSLANCTSLYILNLGNNRLTDTYPVRLASLPSLQVLILKSNRFHGSLPQSIASSNFSALRILDLSGNNFSGTLPPKLFKNLTAMTSKPEERPSSISFYKSSHERADEVRYQISLNVTTKSLELQLTNTVAIFISMDLSNNQFRGQIPEEVGQLISLNMLNFSHNSFTGPIPASFGNLVALESLDLSSNKLGGRIPSQMNKMTFLEVLNLSQNHLVGPIPHGSQFNTFGNDSYIGNLGLCGLPLSNQCGDHGGAEPPAPSVVEHEGNALPVFWKAVMMGYGSGVVLGVSLGYIVFTTGLPWWFVKMVETHLQYKLTNWMRRRNRPKRR